MSDILFASICTIIPGRDHGCAWIPSVLCPKGQYMDLCRSRRINVCMIAPIAARTRAATEAKHAGRCIIPSQICFTVCCGSVIATTRKSMWMGASWRVKILAVVSFALRTFCDGWYGQVPKAKRTIRIFNMNGSVLRMTRFGLEKRLPGLYCLMMP